MYVHLISMLLSFGTMQSDLAYDPRVRAELWRLIGEARYGFAEREEAMFIVRDARGRLSFVRWTSMGVPHQTRWTGAWPRGVIAIAHTHPNWVPEPSRTDVRVAMRNKVPVYVVTRTRITKTSGGATREVIAGDWRPRD
jgi:proteasome lid subunit RPN8/RPN11